jgi:hypothetical protein
MSFIVAKSDGRSENFDPQKLLHSLLRSGASEEVAHAILNSVEHDYGHSKKGGVVTTHEIYARAFHELRGRKRPAAARYSLKRAILDFGPSGFPFEAYVATLFEAEGYSTKLDQLVRGSCVEHEVDIVLTKGDETIYVEAKFHNSLGFKSDLKVSLYVQARIEDIVLAGHHSAKGLLVTNTKFTDAAMEYSACKNLQLLSWDYPQGAALHDKIEAAKAYPVTALTSLSRREKMALLQAKIVLASQLKGAGDVLLAAGVSGHKAEGVLEEAAALCSSAGVL